MQVNLCTRDTMLHHQPKSCVEHNIDYVATCTWHMISTKYYELIFEQVECFQQFLLLHLSCSKNERTQPCWCNVKNYIKWGWWVEHQTQLKRDVANRIVKSFVVVMLNTRKDFISCIWIIWVVHSKDMYNHHVYYLCLSIGMGMEGNRFNQFGLNRGPKDAPKDT